MELKENNWKQDVANGPIKRGCLLAPKSPPAPPPHTNNSQRLSYLNVLDVIYHYELQM